MLGTSAFTRASSCRLHVVGFVGHARFPDLRDAEAAQAAAAAWQPAALVAPLPCLCSVPAPEVLRNKQARQGLSCNYTQESAKRSLGPGIHGAGGTRALQGTYPTQSP